MNTCACKSNENYKKTMKTKNSEISRKIMFANIWIDKWMKNNKKKIMNTNWI